MTEVLYQHGTLALLVPGLFDGTMTISELLAHGDTGIGTGEGLDGELIILDGKPYQFDSFGQVNLVDGDFVVPFANVHQAHFQGDHAFAQLSQVDFYQALEQIAGTKNTFYAVMTRGKFAHVKTRSVAKTTKPYPNLVETADAQSVFEADDVTGTLISYYSPELFHGAAVAGFHSHFLVDDHGIGGHVLDFEIDEVTSAFQMFDTLEQHLPTDNQTFMQHDFSADKIDEAIHHAE